MLLVFLLIAPLPFKAVCSPVLSRQITRAKVKAGLSTVAGGKGKLLGSDSRTGAS